MTEINQDVLDINEALNRYKDTSESVGYADGSIAEVMSERDNANNLDDKEAYSNMIERTDAMKAMIKDDQAKAREDVIRAFAHYYS